MVAKRRSGSKRSCHVTWLWDEIHKKVTDCCHLLLFPPSCHDHAHVALNFKTVATKILPVLWKHPDDEFASQSHTVLVFSYEIVCHVNLQSVRPSYAGRRPHKVCYNFQVLCRKLPLQTFSYIIRVKLGDNGLRGALHEASYAPETCAM